MTRYTIAYLVAMMIIISVAVDRIEDAISDSIFKEEAKTFMKKGGRNTSDMGINLCQRMNKIEAFHDIKATDCRAVYQ